ncbi:hypothetical protein KGF56_001321 [Candida oxycetoniae]|uniref:Uncharacterized protein n=1 Tax=Candida oxycetoniae TaxID=497107 RepID=A0AAI9T0E4_9ASCO|nr:uncharacterized protein KGF56_001321 [Candida oxycetoniae]KAI3405715.1 hypothetical protein KGF56_001321 [Candida oxycetoniae]
MNNEEIIFIIDKLDSSNEDEILRGLNLLDKYLIRLVTELEICSSNGGGNCFLTCELVENFVQLQNNPAYNIASYLVRIYDCNLSDSNLILLNRMLQGCLLLHHSSRSNFNHGRNMKRILTKLDEHRDIPAIISVISTLIHILLKNYENYRSFETNGGCTKLIQHLKLNSIDEIPQQKPKNSTMSPSLISNQQKLNFKIIEFLMLYMIEETNNKNGKSVEEKARLFKQDFPEIDLLVENLNELSKL